MAAPTTGLTTEQVAFFEENGYLIIRNALLPETVLDLVAETRRLLSSFSLEDHPLTRFSTGTKSEHVGDDYFLTSGDKVGLSISPVNPSSQSLLFIEKIRERNKKSCDGFERGNDLTDKF
jgi:hypothetical protein